MEVSGCWIYREKMNVNDNAPLPLSQVKTDRKWEFFLVFGIASAVLVFDWLTKIWAVNRLSGKDPIEIIPDVFRFAYVENTGIAFGLFQNYNGLLHILTPIAFVLLIVIVYKQFAELAMDSWYLLIFGLLIGGALGNVSNRILYGYVIDFIDVFIGSYNWPTFNIADSALTVGEVILVVKLFFWKTPQEHKSEQPESAADSVKSPASDGN